MGKLKECRGFWVSRGSVETKKDQQTKENLRVFRLGLFESKATHLYTLALMQVAWFYCWSLSWVVERTHTTLHSTRIIGAGKKSQCGLNQTEFLVHNLWGMSLQCVISQNQNGNSGRWGLSLSLLGLKPDWLTGECPKLRTGDLNPLQSLQRDFDIQPK